jgi:aryl-alcohol dehydrogenase-like predicted oxidoreductase
MNNRVFGRTGWQVSEIGLGCWQYGGAIMLDGAPDGWPGIDDSESMATTRRAADLGLTFFDTADMYGWGHSEEIVGQALAGWRSKVYIATKVGFWHDADGKRTFNESRPYILEACDASLRRLRTDYIDLYQCHLWRTERWPEFLDAFEQLQLQGKIRHFGISTNDFDMVQRFDERGTLTSVQSNYNLLDRHVEADILPYCRERGIAFIGRGPLAMGKLSGKQTKDTRFAADDIRSKWVQGNNRTHFERDIAVVERLQPVAEKAGLSLPQLAIKFVLSQAGVSVSIPGARNRQQVEQNATVSQLPDLTNETLAKIRDTLVSPA